MKAEGYSLGRFEEWEAMDPTRLWVQEEYEATNWTQ
jgi:hypothetical protein